VSDVARWTRVKSIFDAALAYDGDRRTDVWAFGCVLYEMLTGERAFDGIDAAETLSSVLSQDPDLSRIRPDVPSAIRRVIAGCLEKKRTRRLPTTASFFLLVRGSWKYPQAVAPPPP
jgi:serine/threonine protein kinase